MPVEVPAPSDHLSRTALRTTWEEERLEDLKALEGIEKGFESGVEHGISTGRVKVEVEGARGTVLTQGYVNAERQNAKRRTSPQQPTINNTIRCRICLTFFENR